MSLKYMFMSAPLAAVVVWFITRPRQREDGEPPADADSQETTVFEDVGVAATSAVESVTMNIQTNEFKAEQNRRAFLDMIAASEGTAGPNGYRTMFGGALVEDLSDHPRRYFPFTNGRGQQLTTSAAGRYQFLARTWDSLAAKLGLQDFGEASQDAAALELIRQRGALADVDAGLIDSAIKKCAPIWASLPGAGYAQPEQKMSFLVSAFVGAGGVLA